MTTTTATPAELVLAALHLYSGTATASDISEFSSLPLSAVTATLRDLIAANRVHAHRPSYGATWYTLR